MSRFPHKIGYGRKAPSREWQMLFLQTSSGFISERFIIRLEERTSDQWVVLYQVGMETRLADVHAKDARALLQIEKLSGRFPGRRSIA
jgi:hypothetical protein